MAISLAALHAALKSALPSGAGLVICVADGSGGFTFDLVNGDTASQTSRQLTMTTSVTPATDILILNRSNGDGTNSDLGIFISDFVTAIVTTIHGLTADASPALSNEIATYNTTSNTTGRITLTALQGLLGASSGSGGTSPSMIGSFAAGTPTSSTIPVTYTAATGTATIAYVGWTRPHAGGTWSQNGGTFTGTGGTFTGLTASTSYDLRIVATNSVGSSTTDLTTGVSTAATGGGGRPSLALSSPAFSASKFAQGLAGGTAISPAIAVGSAAAGGLWFAATSGNPYATILQILGLGSFGASFGGADLTGDSSGHPVSSNNPPGATSSPVICDGMQHWVYAESNGGTINAYVDGTLFRTENRALGSSLTVTLAPANIPGCVVSELALWNTANAARKTPPTAQLDASDTNLLGLWRLNGDGVSA